jgi:signal transduction histidine kinase
VKAELRIVGREIVLAVEDNGRGLNPLERAPRPTGGIGIPGMRQRAEGLGGRMELTSQSGKGCSVIIRIPAPRRALSRAII